MSDLADVVAEREDWRGKAEHRLNEWRLRVSDAECAEADRDEAEAARTCGAFARSRPRLS